MRKITFLLGAGIGFVAGSKAGNGPYQQLEAKVREVTKRPSGGQTSNEPTGGGEGYVAPAASPMGNGTAETISDVTVVFPADAEI